MSTIPRLWRQMQEMMDYLKNPKQKRTDIPAPGCPFHLHKESLSSLAALEPMSQMSQMFRASLWLTTKRLQGLRMLLALCSGQKVHRPWPLTILLSLQCTGRIGDGGGVSALLSGSGDCTSELIVKSNRGRGHFPQQVLGVRGHSVCKREFLRTVMQICPKAVAFPCYLFPACPAD